MFYVKVKDLDTRVRIQTFLREKGVSTAFHYIPLHSAPAGIRFGTFHGRDIYTTKESERLFRLPMFYRLKAEDCLMICKLIHEFFIGDDSK